MSDAPRLCPAIILYGKRKGQRCGKNVKISAPLLLCGHHLNALNQKNLPAANDCHSIHAQPSSSSSQTEDSSSLHHPAEPEMKETSCVAASAAASTDQKELDLEADQSQNLCNCQRYFATLLDQNRISEEDLPLFCCKPSERNPNGDRICPAVKKGSDEMCGRVLASGRAFCSAHHNKLNQLHEHLAQFTNHQAINFLGLYLALSFRGNAYNTLQPSLPPESIQNMLSQNRPKSNLVDLALEIQDTGCFDFLLTMLQPKLMGANPHGERGVQGKDQKMRVEMLADMVASNQNYNRLKLLDGHGRTVFGFVLALIERLGNAELARDRLRNFVIEVVEIDPVVYNWHRATWHCDGLEFTPGNIFRKGSGSRLKMESPNTLLYLNFCGIAASLVDTQSMLRLCNKSMLVSLSTIRGAKKYVNGTILLKPEEARDLHQQGIEYVLLDTGRKDFRTFALVKREYYQSNQTTLQPVALQLVYKNLVAED